MEAFSDTFSLIAGVPAIVGLILAAATIFLASNWRMSLTALLVQYVLVGLTLTRFIRAELAIIKIVVGVLAVAMLYLSARHMQDLPSSEGNARGDLQVFGVRLGWQAGPLGLPLRILSLVMVALAAVRFLDDYRALLPVLASDSSSVLVPADLAFVSMWLAGIGVMGLVVSSDPLRVGPAVLTILTAFDLVYAIVEPNLAIIGFVATFTLMAALALAYLITIQGLRERRVREESQATAPPAGLSATAQNSEESAGT